MSQLFTLKLSDNVDTINFMASPFFVMDGGFDISLPRVKRELVATRPGFYLPLISDFEWREAKLRFEIRGASRSAILQSLGRIERLLRNIAARARITAGRRGELSYTWEGATDLTYFEVYGGDIAFPTDVLSVAKIHAKENGQYYIPEIELTLYLSGLGFGTSIFSDTLTEVPLFNPSVGAKQTGGVRVQNPGNGQYSYVEIAGVDLPGSQPLITKIRLTSDTPYSTWQLLYLGLQATNWPVNVVYDDTALVYQSGFSITADANANGGQYRSRAFSANTFSFFSQMEWSVSDAISNAAIMFFAFLHTWSGVPSGFQVAVGIDDYVTYGIRYQGDYVVPSSTTQKNVPIGPIQIPPTEELVRYGTLNPDLWFGLWFATDTAGTMTVDYLSLLPIGNGMRIWRGRTSALTGDLYDDGWRGQEYRVSSTPNVANPFYGLMEPLKLEPGITQRIYFTSAGSQTALSERQRAFVARVYVVPTYSLLAL